MAHQTIPWLSRRNLKEFRVVPVTTGSATGREFHRLTTLWLKKDCLEWSLGDGFSSFRECQWPLVLSSLWCSDTRRALLQVYMLCRYLLAGIPGSPAAIAIFWWTCQAVQCRVQSEGVKKKSLKACRRQVFRLGICMPVSCPQDIFCMWA